MVQISLILHFANEHSYLVRSSLLRKLSLKVAKGEVCCGVGCGTCGGTQAQDESPWIKRPNLVRFGGGRSLEDIVSKNATAPKICGDYASESTLRTSVEHLACDENLLIFR